jgi:hypothetical protein
MVNAPDRGLPAVNDLLRNWWDPGSLINREPDPMKVRMTLYQHAWKSKELDPDGACYGTEAEAEGGRVPPRS